MDTQRQFASAPTSAEGRDQARIIEDIIKIRRKQKKLDPATIITDEDRNSIIAKALDAYKLLNEKICDDGKVLVEYRRGLLKVTEEVIL